MPYEMLRKVYRPERVPITIVDPILNMEGSVQLEQCGIIILVGKDPGVTMAQVSSIGGTKTYSLPVKTRDNGEWSMQSTGIERPYAIEATKNEENGVLYFIFGVAEVRKGFKYPWKSGVVALVELQVK